MPLHKDLTNGIDGRVLPMGFLMGPWRRKDSDFGDVTEFELSPKNECNFTEYQPGTVSG